MNLSSQIKLKSLASLACLALLSFAGTASATVTTTTDNQAGTANTWPFTPSWVVATNTSLINGLIPSGTSGTYNQESQAGTRNVNTLTATTNLTINKISGTTSPNYVTCGNGAGAAAIYTLPASTMGYNITNITVYSGWADNGRDGQFYTVWYSTMANPTMFIPLTSVNYNPSVAGSTPSANRVILSDSLGAAIAQNVAAIKFDFTTPASENNYVGYAAITVGGYAATSEPVTSITTSNQTAGAAGSYTPTWTLEVPSLIANLLPTTSNGNFAVESPTLLGSRNVSSLTANGNQTITLTQVTNTANNTTSPNYVTCGGGAGSGSTLIYTLTNVVNGSDVTNIVVYSGWADSGRFGQYYTVSYSTIAAPSTYLPLTTVRYLPTVAGGVPSANRVAITGTNGPLASGVANVKFDFATPFGASSFNNGYQGYSQIIIQGRDTAAPPPPPSPVLVRDTEPATAANIVGDTVVFTATFSNLPPANVQWYCLSGGVTNIIPGATSSTLTLNNVQLTNTGSYTLKAVNATNGSALPSFSTPASLTVSSLPASVNGIVTAFAAQTGLGNGTVFTPSWTVQTNGSLIAGQAPGAVGAGSFDLELTNSRSVNSLTDGGNGSLQIVPGNTVAYTTSSNYISCGVSPAGQSVTYTLNGSATGFDLTNIVVYGGWGDHGRDEQKYTIRYSTVDSPTLFNTLESLDYNPADPANAQSATQARITSSGGNYPALARNVYAVMFDFNASPAPKNSWEGYAEITLFGSPSLANPILVQDTLPAMASTVVGDQVVFWATFSNSPAANLQWQFVSTNAVVTDIAGATGSTLTLNNVQLTNTGSYRLKAVSIADSAAYTYSTAAPLTVASVPAAVNNIIVTTANQVGLGPVTGVNTSTNFTPTWTANTNGDLVFGSVDGGLNSPGAVYAGAGNFAVSGSGCNGDPVILSDGDPGYVTYYPGVGGNFSLDSCGNTGGQSVTYTLPATSSTGWSLTNITVYGGFGNRDRDELKYQVLYSTVSAPTVFNNLISVDYNPAGLPTVGQSATRTTLVPAAGVMAQNVYAIEINFFNAGSGSENGWSGYSEIVVAGQPSPPVPVLTADIAPVTAEDVVGGSLTLTANFTGADSYQWWKDGTKVPGATSSTLTLNNLQLSDMATNTGYSLVASNASGTNMSSFCKVYVDPAPAAVSNIVTAFAYQTSPSGGFSPTWDTSLLGSSLIAGQNPPLIGYDPNGNFNDPDVTPAAHNMAGGLPVLTDGNYGVFDNAGPHPAFATAGPGGAAPGGGQYVTYTLGNFSPDPNGYTITNIQIAGGWNDNGRDSQYYTVSYSTVQNPTMFFPLATVVNNLSSGNTNGGGNGRAVPSGTGVQTAVRSTLTPATGVLASNVYAIEVDFQFPTGVPNGYSGYSEIAVFGSPSAAAAPAGPVITTAHEETSNVWTAETPNLIANQLPSSVGPGVFTGEGCTEAGLTDGVLAFGGGPNSASCGSVDGGAAQWVVFTPTNGSWNISNIVVYTLWHDYGRDGQYYNVSYSTVSNPATFLPLASVAYNPFVPHNGTATGNRVQISPALSQAMLATNVAAVKFDFTSQGIQDYGWSGYTEIVLQGTNVPSAVVLAPTVSTHASGGNLILTGTGGSPGAPYTWLSTTNLSAPVIWTTNSTGNLDGAGAFSNAIPIGANPATFFRMRLP